MVKPLEVARTAGEAIVDLSENDEAVRFKPKLKSLQDRAASFRILDHAAGQLRRTGFKLWL